MNFEDPNYNIGLPVFTIHGNHDDPGGAGNLSAVDILSAGCLLNYFGKVSRRTLHRCRLVAVDARAGTQFSLPWVSHARPLRLADAGAVRRAGHGLSGLHAFSVSAVPAPLSACSSLVSPDTFPP